MIEPRKVNDGKVDSFNALENKTQLGVMVSPVEFPRGRRARHAVQ